MPVGVKFARDTADYPGSSSQECARHRYFPWLGLTEFGPITFRTEVA